MNFRFRFRGSTKGKTKDERSRLKAVNLNKNEYFLKYKNAFLSVLYRFLRTPKVRCFLVVVNLLPSRETPVEFGFYIRKIWNKHDDILLVLIVIALWATNKTPR